MKFFSVFFIGLMGLSQILFASLEGIQVQREDSLFLRRLEEYWREGEKKIVKIEIEKYLQEKPTASLSGFLQGLLGDLCFVDKDFLAAEASYEKIIDPNIKKRVFLSILRCLYEEKKYDLVIEKAKTQPEFFETGTSSFLWLVGDSAFQLGKTSHNQEHFNLAKSYFEKLAAKENFKEAMIRIAEIYEQMQKKPLAAETYLNLANKLEEKDQELFLFLAAQNYAEQDPSQAISLFDRIVKMNQTKVQEAAYNKLILEYNKEQYPELIKDAENTLNLLAEEKSSLVRYLVAKSYFKLNQFQDAVKHLKQFLNVYEKKDEWMLSSLRILVTCAQALEDEEIFSLVVRHYDSYFPKEKEISKVLLTRAIFYKNHNRLNEAQTDFERIRKNDPSFQDPILAFEEGHLLYLAQKYQDCINTLTPLVGASDDQMQSTIYRCLIQCHHALIKAGNPSSNEKFRELLKLLLAKKDFVREEDRMTYTLALAEHDLSLGFNDESITLLKELIEQSPSKEKLGQAHLLLAEAEYKKDKNFTLYRETTCKALQMKDVSPATVHLALYNALISQTDDKTKLPDEAAEHLFEASKEKEIHYENLLWLADYYYGKWLVTKDQESSSRARTFYEKLLFEKESKKLLLESFPDREECFYFWLNLLEKNSDREQALLKITELYDRKKEGWKLLSKGYFLLGCSFLESKNDEKALLSFKKVSDMTPNSEEMPLSKLYEIRLEVAKLSPEEISSKSEKILNFLKDLKNLKLLKNINTEPAHFEAALDYIDLQMKMDVKKTAQDRLYLLQEMKEYFLQEGDLLSKEYQDQRKANPEKNRLVENYLTFIEGEIDLIKSSLEKNLRYREGAIERFQMLEKSGVSSKFLKERVALRLNDFKMDRRSSS